MTERRSAEATNHLATGVSLKRLHRRLGRAMRKASGHPKAKAIVRGTAERGFSVVVTEPEEGSRLIRTVLSAQLNVMRDVNVRSHADHVDPERLARLVALGDTRAVARLAKEAA